MLDFIYSVKDKRTGIVGYVGVTNNPNVRMAQHVRGHDRNKKKKEWLQSIDPEMDVLEVVKDDRKHALSREKHWIQYYIQQGIPLLNTQLVNTCPLKDKVAFAPRKETKVKKTDDTTSPQRLKRSGTIEELEREWNSYIPTARRCAQLYPYKVAQTEAGMLHVFVSEHKPYNKWKDILPQWEQEKRKGLPLNERRTVPLRIPV